MDLGTYGILEILGDRPTWKLPLRPGHLLSYVNKEKYTYLNFLPQISCDHQHTVHSRTCRIPCHSCVLVQFSTCSPTVTRTPDDFVWNKMRLPLIFQPLRDFRKRWPWSVITTIKDAIREVVIHKTNFGNWMCQKPTWEKVVVQLGAWGGDHARTPRQGLWLPCVFYTLTLSRFGCTIWPRSHRH